MERNIRLSEKMFMACLGAMLLFLLLHDWVPLGPFNDPASVRRENTTGELLLVTVVNGLSVGFLLLLAGLFAGKKYPLWLRSWFVIHSGLILAGAAEAWRLPYLFGADEKRLQRDQAMFGGTRSFLPELNGITADILHAAFHSVLLFSLLLAVYLFVTKINEKPGFLPGFFFPKDADRRQPSPPFRSKAGGISHRFPGGPGGRPAVFNNRPPMHAREPSSSGTGGPVRPPIHKTTGTSS